jgi:hypothetical protein
VIILAGAYEVEVQVAEAALVRSSALFRKAWAARRGDGTTMALMKLPGIDPEHFRLYQHWLRTSEIDYAVLGSDKEYLDYTDEFRCMPHRVPTPSMEERVTYDVLADELVYLYAIGDLLWDSKLRKTVLAELSKWYLDESVPSIVSAQTIDFVDRITQVKPMDPLRQFCARWVRCQFKIRGDCCRLSQTAPEWLSDALLISQSEDDQDENTRKWERKKKKVAAKKAKQANIRKRGAYKDFVWNPPVSN